MSKAIKALVVVVIVVGSVLAHVAIGDASQPMSRSAVHDSRIPKVNDLVCIGNGVPNARLGSLIQKYFPIQEFERACDTSWGESNHRQFLSNGRVITSTTGCCIGYFQIHTSFHRWRGLPFTLESEEGNVKAAASLWAEQGWKPWDASSVQSNARAVITNQPVGELVVSQVNSGPLGLPETK